MLPGPGLTSFSLWLDGLLESKALTWTPYFERVVGPLDHVLLKLVFQYRLIPAARLRFEHRKNS